MEWRGAEATVTLQNLKVTSYYCSSKYCRLKSNKHITCISHLDSFLYHKPHDFSILMHLSVTSDAFPTVVKVFHFKLKFFWQEIMPAMNSLRM